MERREQENSEISVRFLLFSALSIFLISERGWNARRRGVERCGDLEDHGSALRPRIGSDYKMLNGIVVDLVTHLNFIRAGNWLRSKRSWKNRLGQRKVAITPCLLL